VTRNRTLLAVLAGAAAAIAAASGSPAAAPSPGEATSAQAPNARFMIGTHNMLRGAGTFTRFAGVIGWQEVNDPPDRVKMRRQLGPDYRHYVPPAGPAKAVPISWRRGGFILRDSGSVRTHGGEAKVTPARYVNWVVLQRRGTKKRFAFVNTHFISGAWNKHPNRQARWRTHAGVLRDVVRRLRGRGLRVFVVGDFNRRSSIPLPDQAYVPVKGSRAVPLDQVYVTRGTSHSRAQRLPRNGSDHHAYRATVAF
jgi:hypothetical protein